MTMTITATVMGGSEDVSNTPQHALSPAQAVRCGHRALPPAGHLSDVEQPEAFTSALINHFEVADGRA